LEKIFRGWDTLPLCGLVQQEVQPDSVFIAAFFKYSGLVKKVSIASNIVLLNKIVKNYPASFYRTELRRDKLAEVFQFGIAVWGGRVKSHAVSWLNMWLKSHIKVCILRQPKKRKYIG